MNDAFSTNFTIHSKSKREKEVYEEYYTRDEKYIPRKDEKPCKNIKLLQINGKKEAPREKIAKRIENEIS